MFLSDPPPDERVQAIYDEQQNADGYVKNLTRLWCWRPDVLEAFVHARELVLQDSGWSARDMALLVAATAAARSDSYCAIAWGARLAASANAETAARVVSGSAEGLDNREARLVRWARQVATDPNSTTPADVGALREAGLTDRQIFEATVFIALRLAFSTVNDALGAPPDLQLSEAAPSPVRAAVTYGRQPAELPSA